VENLAGKRPKVRMSTIKERVPLATSSFILIIPFSTGATLTVNWSAPVAITGLPILNSVVKRKTITVNILIYFFFIVQPPSVSLRMRIYFNAPL